MKIEKIKVSDTTYAEIQKMKQNNNIANDEECVNMLIQYYNDPLFHLTDDFKMSMIKMMDKQSEENTVSNLEEMIHRMIEEIKQYQ